MAAKRSRLFLIDSSNERDDDRPDDCQGSVPLTTPSKISILFCLALAVSALIPAVDGVRVKLLFAPDVVHLPSYFSAPERGRRDVVFAPDDDALFDDGDRDVRFSLRGKPGLGYHVAMNFGTPPQTLNVLVDTGSSNLAVACSPDGYVDRYFRRGESSSWRPTGKKVAVPYTQGRWEGPLVTEIVGVADDGEDLDSTSDETKLTSVRANLACIETSENFFINGSKWHGILGLGFPLIARPSPDITPYLDTLKHAGSMPQDFFALQLCGTVDKSEKFDVAMGGILDLGEMEDSAYTGPIFYTPLRKRWYYDVVMTNVDVNGISVGVNRSCQEFNVDKTIVDSGTTNLRLPVDIFKRLILAIQDQIELRHPSVPVDFWLGREIMCWKRGSTPWKRFPEIGLWLVNQPSTQQNSLPHTPSSITNNTPTATSSSPDSSTHFRLVISPQQYLRALDARAYETSSPLEDVEDCYKFAVTPSETGSVIGAVVMEGFYVVFDREKDRVGFALSSCPLRDPLRVKGPRIEGPFPFRPPPLAMSSTSSSSLSSEADGFSSCAYSKPESSTTTMIRYAVYGIAAMCVLIASLLLALVLQVRCSGDRRRPKESEAKSRTGAQDSAPSASTTVSEEAAVACATETPPEDDISSATEAPPLLVTSSSRGTLSRSASIFGGAIWKQSRDAISTPNDDDQRILVQHESEADVVEA